MDLPVVFFHHFDRQPHRVPGHPGGVLVHGGQIDQRIVR